MRDWCEKDDGDERLREEERVLRKRRIKEQRKFLFSHSNFKLFFSVSHG